MRVHPFQHARSHVRLEQLPLDEELQHGTTERLGQDRGVVQRHREERTVGQEAAVGDQGVDVGIPVEQRAVRLDGEHDADRHVVADRGADERDYGRGGYPGKVAEKVAPPEEVWPQALGQGEHELPMRHGRQHVGLEPRWCGRCTITSVTARHQTPTSSAPTPKKCSSR